MSVCTENNQVFPLEISRKTRSVKAYFSAVFPEEYPRLEQSRTLFLQQEEEAYWHKVQHQKRKMSYLSGRYAGKMAVAQHVNEHNLAQIAIQKGTFEQPIVKYDSSHTPEVTISHCERLAVAIAFEAGHYMGVDIEKLDLSKEKVYVSQLTAEEITACKNSTVNSQTLYNVIWTIKEAFSKTIKVGFMTPFVVLETKSLTVQDNGVIVAYFKNFAQYKCYSWIASQVVLSIALPKNSELSQQSQQSIFEIVSSI